LPAWLVAGGQDLGEFGGMYLRYDPAGPTRQLHKSETVYGANMGFRRDVFSKVGGFRADLDPFPGGPRLGGDTEFSGRLVTAGLAGVYVAPALVQHMTPASRLTVKYALGWAFANGRDAARIRAIRRERQGRNTWPRRARDAAKHAAFLTGNLVLAATAGWFLGSRRRMALWMRVATCAGIIAGSLAGRPDLSLDWPAVLGKPQIPVRL
jgi:GT2 family glycosyltransferase